MADSSVEERLERTPDLCWTGETHLRGVAGFGRNSTGGTTPGIEISGGEEEALTMMQG